MFKERPILFSGPMVRAILDGRKTQTRRAMQVQPRFNPHQGDGCWYPEKTKKELYYANEAHFRRGVAIDFSPFGQPGDRLWVRETWAQSPVCIPCDEGLRGVGSCTCNDIYYRSDAGSNCLSLRWRPSIHMPRWASRITLEITNVRVERLQDISAEDAKHEGVESWMESLEENGTYDSDAHLNGYFTTAFARMWSRVTPVNGETCWTANPWVWVVEFKMVET